MNSPERVLELLRSALPPERVQPPRSSPRAAPARQEGLPLVTPSSEEEALEVVRLARSEGLVILPMGLGSKLGWSARASNADLLLSSRALSGITAFEPADGTITARAGTPWSELVAATGPQHHLSPDLPAAARCTLGGTLGAGVSGFDRLRFGPLRHHVLGIRALHADGSRVKSGGRVVKNVTGYDLHRLWCGSEGSLCFLLEASLRLHPAPTSVVALRQTCTSLRESVQLGQALWRGGIQPMALTCQADGLTGEAQLTVVLAGRREAVQGETEAARKLLPAARVGDGAEGPALAAEQREAELRDGEPAPLLLTCRPSRLGDVLERLEHALEGRGIDLRCHPLLASLSLRFPGSELNEDTATTLTQALAGDGLTLRWRAGPRAGTPPAVVPAAAKLMQRLKESLDPDGVFVRARSWDT